MIAQFMCNVIGAARTAEEGVGFGTGGAIAESGAGAGVFGYLSVGDETSSEFPAGVRGTAFFEANGPGSIRLCST